MNPVFKNRVWELLVAPQWCVTDCDHCVEITQSEGVGAMHISSARKTQGMVESVEMLEQLKNESPDGTELEEVHCGDFHGYTAEYVDWNSGSYWRKWFVACRHDLLYITYTCKSGDEDLECTVASALLSTLRSKA